VLERGAVRVATGDDRLAPAVVQVAEVLAKGVAMAQEAPAEDRVLEQQRGDGEHGVELEQHDLDVHERPGEPHLVGAQLDQQLQHVHDGEQREVGEDPAEDEVEGLGLGALARRAADGADAAPHDRVERDGDEEEERVAAGVQSRDALARQPVVDQRHGQADGEHERQAGAREGGRLDHGVVERVGEVDELLQLDDEAHGEREQDGEPKG